MPGVVDFIRHTPYPVLLAPPSAVLLPASAALDVPGFSPGGRGTRGWMELLSGTRLSDITPSSGPARSVALRGAVLADGSARG